MEYVRTVEGKVFFRMEPQELKTLVKFYFSGSIYTWNQAVMELIQTLNGTGVFIANLASIWDGETIECRGLVK